MLRTYSVGLGFSRLESIQIFEGEENSSGLVGSAYLRKIKNKKGNERGKHNILP